MRIFSLGLVIGAFLLQTMAALPLAAEDCVQVMIASAAALVLAFGLVARKKASGTATFLSIVFMLVIGVVMGFSYANWRAESRLSHELPRAWEGRDVEVIGIVASLPTVNERGTRFEFDIERALAIGAEIPPPIPTHISLTWYVERPKKGEAATPPPEIKPGERWHLTVKLRRPHGTLNPHGYDFEAFALEQNIRATGYIRSKGVNEKRDDFVESFPNRVDRVRMAIRDRINVALKDLPHRGVLVALAIGEQNAVPAEQWKVFWRTGIGHLVSISGLHITMVASLLYWLTFRIWAKVPALALRLPAQRAAVLAGALTALIYSLVAGFSVPTQRTLFMLSTVAVALWVGRTTSATRMLSWALFAVILLDPWAVLAPGFWLSFGAVAAIFYVTAHRTGKLSSLKGAVLTQVAVTLGLLPMTLALFQEVSVVSPIANAFAIPIVSLVVVPTTLLGAALSFIGPFDWLLQLAHEIFAGCYWALTWLSSTPNAVWQSHAPQPWTIALAMLGCAWWLLPRGVAPRWLGIIFALPMFVMLPPKPQDGELWVTLLDVGQGLATVVQTANHTLVYDTGPRFNPDSDSGNRIIVPYLRGEGIRELDALVVTHADEDHSGGAKSLIDARNPKWVMTSMAADHESFKNAAEVIRCDMRDDWHWDGVYFNILHPTIENYDDERRKTNDVGCTLKITAPGGSILMTADIEKRSEYELLARAANDPAELKADVMVVPHHGSKTSSTEAFIDAVSPKLALVPVGYRSRFRHPNAEVMARYSDRGIKIIRTDEWGALTLKFGADSNGAPTVTRYREHHKRYWLDWQTGEGALE